MTQIMSRAELLALPTGVIVTLYGGWTGEKGSKLHRTGCRHIRRMTAHPEKWWGPTLEAVRAWVAESGTGPLLAIWASTKVA